MFCNVIFRSNRSAFLHTIKQSSVVQTDLLFYTPLNNLPLFKQICFLDALLIYCKFWSMINTDHRYLQFFWTFLQISSVISAEKGIFWTTEVSVAKIDRKSVRVTLSFMIKCSVISKQQLVFFTVMTVKEYSVENTFKRKIVLNVKESWLVFRFQIDGK